MKPVWILGPRFTRGNGVRPVLFTFVLHPSHELLQFPSFPGQSPEPPHPLREGAVLYPGPQPPTPSEPSSDPWPVSGSTLPRQWGEVVIARGNRAPRDTRRVKRGFPRRSRDDGEGRAQRRRGAEEMGFSISSSESPNGARVQGGLNSHLSLLLSVSAPLREISAAGVRLRNGDEDVASPLHAGAVSRCARRRGSAGFHLDGSGGDP